MQQDKKYIDVILPLAVPKVYSYSVPEELRATIQFGIRVEVPLRNKLYSALVIGEKDKIDGLQKARDIRSIIDEEPIISQKQYTLWQWMSQYYMTTIGEVMNVALPTGLKLSSTTKLIATPSIEDHFSNLTEKEYLLAEAIAIQQEITIDKAQEIVEQKTVYPIIKSLLDKQILFIKEELVEKFKPKMEDYIRFTDLYRNQDTNIPKAFDLVARSEKQTRALLSYVQLSRNQDWIPKTDLYKLAQIDNSVIKALQKKSIFEVEAKEVSRISKKIVEEKSVPDLNPFQADTIKEIRSQFEAGTDNILLFGITGSGKTRIYIDLIKETIAQGKQVLYLLPEIALTTQIVDRLLTVFDGDIGVYHSKMSNNQRVELWNASLEGKHLILGARSSLFLPFKDLGLIIIDEEHDPSYKQTDPAPRYSARDTALYLAKLYNSKVILGSATPSLETFWNARQGKYGIVRLFERHGESELPDIEIVDLKQQYKKGLMRSLFSKDLKDAIDTALANNEQVLVFQNRRGYSPALQCKVCDFCAQCPNCDVSLTVHHYFEELRCHYCGYRHKLPQMCPQCGFDKLDRLGFGTEKIENEIVKVFPEAKVARLDFDTAKTKNAFERILSRFKSQDIDILVGTQMITKGLDFDNIAIVGVLNADKILYFPDYKASERAFQLFTQVAGRAGRRAKKGKVILQTFNPDHPVVRETRDHDFKAFYNRELVERKRFLYPPFYRMISITVKHKKADVASDVAHILVGRLKKQLGKRVIGPTVPGISRLRGMYQQQIIIKMEKNIKIIQQVKTHLDQNIKEILEMEGKKSTRIVCNVDP
ncbi:MAG: primosomal protein N' [Saprospiraceae bacterium]|nr:primosomal protein N' [Saprospiraceae bacterium]